MGVMTLVDTSAWVEYLRDTSSAVCESVDQMIASGKPLATTDVVIMELLAGCRTDAQRRRIRAFMNRCSMVPTRSLFDYETAGVLYAACRESGFTPSNSNDVLIAAVAIGRGFPVLASDTGFERIAAVSSLELIAA